MISRRARQLVPLDLPTRQATTARELNLHAHDLMPLVALEVVCLEPLEHLGWAMLLGFALCTHRPASTACLPALLGSGEDSDDDVHALC